MPAACALCKLCHRPEYARLNWPVVGGRDRPSTQWEQGKVSPFPTQTCLPRLLPPAAITAPLLPLTSHHHLPSSSSSTTSWLVTTSAPPIPRQSRFHARVSPAGHRGRQPSPRAVPELTLFSRRSRAPCSQPSGSEYTTPFPTLHLLLPLPSLSTPFALRPLSTQNNICVDVEEPSPTPTHLPSLPTSTPTIICTCD